MWPVSLQQLTCVLWLFSGWCELTIELMCHERMTIGFKQSKVSVCCWYIWWNFVGLILFVCEAESIQNNFSLYTLICHCLNSLYYNLMILSDWSLPLKSCLCASPSSLYGQKVHLSQSFLHKSDWKREKQPAFSCEAILRFTDWLQGLCSCLPLCCHCLENKQVHSSWLPLHKKLYISSPPLLENWMLYLT